MINNQLGSSGILNNKNHFAGNGLFTNSDRNYTNAFPQQTLNFRLPVTE